MCIDDPCVAEVPETTFIVIISTKLHLPWMAHFNLIEDEVCTHQSHITNGNALRQMFTMILYQ